MLVFLPDKGKIQPVLSDLDFQPPRRSLPDSGTIERRPVLQEKGPLQFNGLFLRGAFFPLDLHHPMNEAQGPSLMILLCDMSVAANPSPEIQRLTNVEQLAMSVVKEVNPRLSGQGAKLVSAQTLGQRIAQGEQSKLFGPWWLGCG